MLLSEKNAVLGNEIKATKFLNSLKMCLPISMGWLVNALKKLLPSALDLLLLNLAYKF